MIIDCPDYDIDKIDDSELAAFNSRTSSIHLGFSVEINNVTNCKFSEFQPRWIAEFSLSP